MKRKFKKEYEHGIFNHYTIFTWHQCCMCLADFRRERGYRILVGPFCGGAGHWNYLCPTCASIKERVNTIAINKEYMPARPPAPPAPPKRKYKCQQ